MDELAHLINVFGELDEFDRGVGSQDAQPRILLQSGKIWVKVGERWVVEESVVGPIAVDGPAKSLLLERAQESSAIGVVSPSDLGVDFCPLICYFAVGCHLDEQSDC